MIVCSYEKCGKEIEPKRSTQKFCIGTNCRTNQFREDEKRKAREVNAKLPPKYCACGEHVTVTKTGVQLDVCDNPRCRAKEYYHRVTKHTKPKKKKVKKEVTYVTCEREECGKTVPRVSKMQRYCNPGCREIHTNKVKAEERLKRKPKPAPERTHITISKPKIEKKPALVVEEKPKIALTARMSAKEKLAAVAENKKHRTKEVIKNDAQLIEEFMKKNKVTVIEPSGIKNNTYYERLSSTQWNKGGW